ncbi:MAG: hypothetical protein PHY45_05010 [Rhodocyclaceae bacterium]|nr:hypothetical protein [Rhodocyclaceae bacterium]
MSRIVNVLVQSPGLSKEEIAERAFVGAATLSGGGYLKTMKEAGLIHVSGWARNASGGFTTPLYSAGKSADCARPQVTGHNRAAPGMLRLLEAVRDFGPLDYREAAKRAGLSPNTVKNAGYLELLVAQEKLHIDAWRRGRNGPMRPVYGFGPGAAAPRPPALTSAEKSKAHRWRKAAVAGSSSLAMQIRMAAGCRLRVSG